jgi:hypothetical protein
MANLPWFSRGDYYIDMTNEKEPKAYQLIAVEALPNAVYTFDSVAPADEGDFIRMDSTHTDLETDKEDLFFQYFFGVLKDGLVYMQYPLGEEFWTSDKLIPTSAKPNVACVTFQTTPYLDPAPDTEFFMQRGTSVAFKFRNIVGYTMDNKIRFVGKKFRRQLVPLTPEVVAKARTIRFARIGP